eukprot:scaffold12959_cov116-Isochrysis_galbana.AAC.10
MEKVASTLAAPLHPSILDVRNAIQRRSVVILGAEDLPYHDAPVARCDRNDVVTSPHIRRPTDVANAVRVWQRSV